MHNDSQKITQLIYEDPEIVDGYIKRNSSKTYNPVYLNTFFDLLKGKRVLDLGCGPGKEVQELNKKGLEVTGLDLSNEMIKRAKTLEYTDPQPKFLVGSMLNLKDYFKENSFDGIWAAASLLHIRKTDVDRVLEGMKYILTKDGIAMISLKAGTGTQLVDEDKYGKPMKREFTFWEKEEFIQRIKPFGFNLISYRNGESSSTINGKQVEFNIFMFELTK